MPVTLHPHLKRKLSFEDNAIEPEDAIEVQWNQDLDLNEEIFKRRRIEAIAAQYLRGRRPLILSATLCGPFERWRNPWAQTSTSARRTPSKRRISAAWRGDVLTGNSTKERDASSTIRGLSGAGASHKLRMSSPEASRAPAEQFLSHMPTSSLDNVEVPQATASTQSKDYSDTTESFSLLSDSWVIDRSRLIDSFWLRRRSGKRSRGSRYAHPESPLRPKSAEPSSDKLHLAQPKLPLGIHASLLHAVLQEKRCLSASAATATQSLGKSDASRAGLSGTSPHSTALDQLDESEDASSDGKTPVQIVPQAAQDAETYGFRVSKAMKCASQRVQFKGSESPTARTKSIPSDVQDSEPTRGASNVKQPSLKSIPAQQITNGMMQQLPRVKRRYVDFSTSPITIHRYRDGEKQVIVGGMGKCNGQTNRQSSPASISCQPFIRPARPPSLQAGVVVDEDQSPTEPSETPRAWSQPERETPLMVVLSQCASDTPLSAFKVHRELSQPVQSMASGPLASTQDLFGAASPFVVSAVKKTSKKPGRSSLRHSMMSLDQHDVHMENTGIQQLASPTHRIALKEKNAILGADSQGMSMSQIAQKLLESPVRQSMTT